MRMLALLCCCAMLSGAMQEQIITSEFEGQRFEGTIVYNDASDAIRPGIVMVPNWMGPTASSLEKAKLIADMGYVVYMADVYGTDVRPKDSGEAGKAAGALRADRPLLRRRCAQQVAQLKAQAGAIPLDPERLAAIGFCFGGGAVLEMARDGSDVAAVVSFHGNLDTPDTSLAKNITAKILVCHGNADPVVPPEQVTGFFNEMKGTGVDYQFLALSETYHSFTNPEANRAGMAIYSAKATERSYAAMRQLFGEVFSLGQ